MSHYSTENGDCIGTTTYRDTGRYHCLAIAPTGRRHSCVYQRDAVKWLTTQYNRTH
jgi:hypothetical protein